MSRRKRFCQECNITDCTKKNLFTVHFNRTLRLELFAPPTSLNFSVHLPYISLCRRCSDMSQGHPTTVFGRISVRKTIGDLEFSKHLL